MGQEPAKGYFFFPRIRKGFAQFSDWVIQMESALAYEVHGRQGRGQGFGQGGQVKNRLQPHGPRLGMPGCLAVSLMKNYFLADPDEQDGPGEDPLLDGFFHGVINFGKIRHGGLGCK